CGDRREALPDAFPASRIAASVSVDISIPPEQEWGRSGPRGDMLLRTDVLPRGLADRDHGRMLALALDRDGVELLANGFRTADDAHPISAGALLFGQRPRGGTAP